ncbi:MAG: PTS IIA-like nitrogen regulatory protein PtsN [Neisseria sp.]|nr:PTS IIA-like nitrogen regulatory protein PtsN [Neisseria sp.]
MSLIGEILPAENILPNVSVSSKKRVLEEIALLLENRYGLMRGEVFDCLFAREKLGSTGLGQGVAIPHGRFAGIDTTVAVFLRLQEAVSFDAPDGKPVNLVFALLVPENAAGHHLEILSRLADIFSTKTAREALLQASSAEEVRAVFL